MDNILIIGSSSALIHNLINKMNVTFALKRLGKPSYVQGIEVNSQTNCFILLTQSKYIRDLLYLFFKAKMNIANEVPTPICLAPAS